MMNKKNNLGIKKTKITFIENYSNVKFDLPNADSGSDQSKKFTIVFRQDPLTREKSIIVPHLVKKQELFYQPTDWSLVEKLFDSSEMNCPFCNVELFTPTFSSSSGLSPRIINNEAVVFPNLYPQAPNHAVVRLTRKHKLLPKDFTKETLADGFTAAISYFREALSLGKCWFAAVNWNYLNPAGATLTHPHFQLVTGEENQYPNYFDRLLIKAKKYYEQTGKNYWEDLISVEKEVNERYLGSTGNIHWFVPFAPRANYETRAVFPISNINNIEETLIDEFSGQLSKIIRMFAEEFNCSSFNFSLMGLFFENKIFHHPEMKVVFTIITRQNISENYRCDDNFMSKILQTNFIGYSPEKFALKVKKIFS